MSEACPKSNPIRTQVEYYFGDVNLPRDKFLKERISESREGFVQLSVLLTFKKIKELGVTTVEQLAEALKGSTLLTLNTDSTAVKRTAPLPVCDGARGQSDDSNTVRLQVDDSMRPVVIGPRGSNIRDIEERSGAKVDLRDGYANIRGDAKQVAAAKKFIEEVISLATHEPRSRFVQQLAEVMNEPFLTYCAVTDVRADRGFCIVKSQELGREMVLHCSNCYDKELPNLSQHVLCIVSYLKEERKFSAKSSIRFPFGPVQCRVEANRNGICILRSPVVDFGRCDITLSTLSPGVALPMGGLPIGEMIPCLLHVDDRGELVADDLPPLPPAFDGFLIADCICGDHVPVGARVSASAGFAPFAPLTVQRFPFGPQNAAIPPDHRILLQENRTGLGGLPRPQGLVRCWLKQSKDKPQLWDAWLLPPETRLLPSGQLPVKPIPLNYITGLPKLSDDFPANFELSHQVQTHLSELFEDPAVRLDDGSRSGDTLFVVCDSDIVRLADRWNLGMDVIPLASQKRMNMWCMLLRFHSALCLERFSVQLSFYFLSRKMGDDSRGLITPAPRNIPSCIRAASVPANDAPIIALDDLIAKIKDDAIQVFEEPSGDGGITVVARMYIATPFTQQDVDNGRSNLNHPDFFDRFLPDVMRESRVNLMTMYGTRVLNMFRDNDKFGLDSATDKIAACYELRFVKTLNSTGEEAEETFVPTGPMTISLKPCRIHYALTFEQVSAFEDGDLRLPTAAANSLRLLRRLVDSHQRECKKVAAIAVTEEERPCRIEMKIRPERNMFRISVEAGVPTSKDLNRAPLYKEKQKRNEASRVTFLNMFRDGQNAALFLSFGFSLKSERTMSEAQKATLDAKLDQLGLPKPAGATFEGYRKALHIFPMSTLLEGLGSNTVETKVPALLVDEAFLDRISPTDLAELRSTKPSDGLYWDAYPALRPKRGVDIMKPVPTGTLPFVEMIGDFLTSTHPLREYNHLLGQFLLLLLGKGGGNSGPQEAAVSDSTRLALMRHAIDALLELNHKWTLKSLDVKDFLCNDRLPYPRVQLAEASLAELRHPKPGLSELVFWSDDVRHQGTHSMQPMAFEVSDNHPLVTSWPGSFGTCATVILRTDARHALPRELMLVPADASLADVLTDDDWKAILTSWQGRRIQQLIHDNETARKVQVNAAAALTPGRLC